MKIQRGLLAIYLQKEYTKNYKKNIIKMMIDKRRNI